MRYNWTNWRQVVTFSLKPGIYTYERPSLRPVVHCNIWSIDRTRLPVTPLCPPVHSVEHPLKRRKKCLDIVVEWKCCAKSVWRIYFHFVTNLDRYGEKYEMWGDPLITANYTDHRSSMAINHPYAHFGDQLDVKIFLVKSGSWGTGRWKHQSRNM